MKPSASWRVQDEVVAEVAAGLTDTLWQRGFAWMFLACGVGYYFLVARHYADADANMVAHVKALLLIVVSQIVLWALYRRLLNRVEIGPGLRRLQTKVPSERACPVGVEIRQDGIVTGYDEGYMWIEDGTLFFKGLQTVFRINREDVPPVGLWPRADRPKPGGKRPDTIPIPVADRNVKLKVKLIDPFEDYNARRRALRFESELLEWLTERPQGWLESLLPPLEVHPSLRAALRWRHEGFVGALVMAAVNLGLILGTPWRLDLLRLSSLGAAVAIAAGFVLLGCALRLALASWGAARLRETIPA